jgi:hypothetical protein
MEWMAGATVRPKSAAEPPTAMSEENAIVDAMLPVYILSEPLASPYSHWSCRR